MSRSSSRLTSGRRSTPRTRVKIAALAPMPRARVSTTVITSPRSEEHTSELQSRLHLVCRLLLEKKINTVSLWQKYLLQRRSTSTPESHSLALLEHTTGELGNLVVQLSLEDDLQQLCTDYIASSH